MKGKMTSPGGGVGVSFVERSKHWVARTIGMARSIMSRIIAPMDFIVPCIACIDELCRRMGVFASHCR